MKSFFNYLLQNMFYLVDINLAIIFNKITQLSIFLDSYNVILNWNKLSINFVSIKKDFNLSGKFII